MSSSGSSLEERYGAPSPTRRIVVIVVAAVVSVVFLGWLGWAALFHSDPAVSSELTTWDQVDDHTTEATLRVEFGDGWIGAECTVRAIAEDKTVVGSLTFTPTDNGEDTVNEVVEIATERRPTAVESLGCTADGQPRPR